MRDIIYGLFTACGVFRMQRGELMRVALPGGARRCDIAAALKRRNVLMRENYNVKEWAGDFVLIARGQKRAPNKREER